MPTAFTVGSECTYSNPRPTASTDQLSGNAMSTFDRLLSSLRNLWRGDFDARFRRRPLPPITYAQLNIVKQPPRNHEIAPGAVTIVAPARYPKWSMLLCPCGCRSVITLPLQSDKRPHWSFRKSKAGRPTLQPSIWRDVGCLSHFFLDDGRIYWCNDTGISPRGARTNSYLRREYARRNDPAKGGP